MILEIFISSISGSKYDNYNSNFNRNINILKIYIQYRFTYTDGLNNNYTIKIPSVNNTLINIDNIKNIESNKKYDYLLIKNATTTTYTNNSTTNFKLTDVEDVFTLKILMELHYLQIILLYIINQILVVMIIHLFLMYMNI